MKEGQANDCNTMGDRKIKENLRQIVQRNNVKELPVIQHPSTILSLRYLHQSTSMNESTANKKASFNQMYASVNFHEIHCQKELVRHNR